METKYDALLFDLDGTLADTYAIVLSCFRYSIHEVLGKDLPDEELMKKVGQPLAVQMEDFSDDANERAELLRVYSEYSEEIHDNMITVFPGVIQGLAQLKLAGYKMAIVTSKRRYMAEHGTKLLGIHGFFDEIVSSDDTEKHKPNPEPVLYACEKLGVNPEKCAFVGDSPFDLQAGRDAGCDTIAVSWGMFDMNTLLDEHPTVYCEEFEEIVRAAGVNSEELAEELAEE